jgi:sugar phosphate isomerase/epimerase
MATFKGQKIPTCYASCSIGHDESHTLPKKLEAIAAAGFDAIELSMPDILTYGQQISDSGAEIDPKDYATLRSVGQKIGELCKKEGLKILILQPFANFEGWPRGSKEREDAWERAKGWMSIMEATGTDMMQVGHGYTAALYWMVVLTSRPDWFLGCRRHIFEFRRPCYRFG